MDKELLLKQVKKAIYEIEPEADIILYGSRSRGDSYSDSDWDFFILVNGIVDNERTDRIRHRLYDIELECGEILSSIIRNRREWHSFPYIITPIYEKIKKEGVII